ncbi:MAG TPA: hypothetical protein VH206_10715 [Xanthobacteraceae bacterium]|jgi:hypothetical protein|nr:hypothetical protein [Xanthobacteraceae bacterium]
MTPRSIVSFTLALTLALGAVLMLAPSAEAKKAKRPRASYAANAEQCRGGNQFPCGPVYFGDYYLGTDPDPFIRSQIQRDLGAKFGGPD